PYFPHAANRDTRLKAIAISYTELDGGFSSDHNQQWIPGNERSRKRELKITHPHFIS
ncbi:hypothetical protein L9F63_013218, partial [Diploptera punctata]